MTTDEIVRALHKYAKNAQENFEVDTMRGFDSAADLIESLQAKLADYHHMSELVDGKMAENQRLRRINENLTARAEKAEAENRWIPVNERLPEDVGSYLVYYHEWSNGDFLPKYDDYRIRVMRFMNNGKWCMPVCTDKRCEAATNRDVTHWMPLPEPPRKDDEA